MKRAENAGRAAFLKHLWVTDP